jgi:hypothetical protein
MYFVPEGQHDRSHSTRYRLLMAGLARSARESVHRENPSRRVRYDLVAIPDIPGIILIEDVRRLVVLEISSRQS